MAHFVIAAMDRVSSDAFKISHRAVGQPRYHPRMMLGILIYGSANGFFSSRRLEWAIYRDLGVRLVAADRHPDHDTIATFRRENRTAFEAAFLEVLLMAKESGVLKLGTVSIDGTKSDANASKIRSLRYDRALVLIVATNVAMATTPSDQPVFVETITAIEALKAKDIDPLVAISATQPHRPYDFRPPPERDKPERAIKEPWRIEMKEKLKTTEGRKMYKLRKQTVEPVFGIIKSVLGFRAFRLRCLDLEKVKSKWALIALAYNCKSQ